MPDDAPVTTARRPARSVPAMTPAAVEAGPNGVVIRAVLIGFALVMEHQPAVGRPEGSHLVREDLGTRLLDLLLGGLEAR
jgi:hypothetical protein